MTEKGKHSRVAAVQLAPVLFDRDATTEKVLKAVEGCSREGVRLAVTGGLSLEKRNPLA